MRYPNRLFYFTLQALFLIFISGCGFHLRGKVDVPTWFNNVAIIKGQTHNDLASLLRMELQSQHIQVNSSESSADYWLILESDNVQQHITSVSSSTTPRQYQLIYTVHFKLQQRNGRDIIPEATLMITRQLTINGNRILGSNEEEELLKAEMRRDAVIQIMNRISQVRFTQKS